ncbi:MAG: imidazolonepropionase [Flavobacteriales bacterium]|nr:MAG: imidazolonepropionase [Flavobacteriales bacterium]
MSILITNIKELIQVRELGTDKVSGEDMKNLPTLKNAYLLIENDCIADFGPMEKAAKISSDKTIDVSGKMILPTWCDSHTHLVYAGNRESEFIDKINGLSYEAIAEKGGGILNSAITIQNTPEAELYRQSAERLREIMQLGTGAIEIKSGYGLSVDAEIKMLRVIKELKKNFPIAIKSTFLGAHAFPAAYKADPDAYIDLIINEMLPKITAENLAEYIDVFCEKNYFSVQQTERILEAGRALGLTPKIHVNQFNSIGGVQIAVNCGALTVDHLEVLNKNDIIALKNSKTMPVALPLCSFFLGIPYTPAAKLIEAGLPLVLASDYNPGSAPSGNMNLVVSTACIKMKITPEEAINAATLNGAAAMGLSSTLGSITIGKKANFIITKKIPSYGFLPYAFGSNLIEKVFINGLEIK